MSNVTNIPRIYVACLASYNAGILYGKWIDVYDDHEIMLEEIGEMLEGSKQSIAEDWAIHDTEYVPSSVYRAGLTMICRWLGEWNKADEWGNADLFNAWCSYQGVDDFNGNIYEQFNDSYRGTYDTVEDYVHAYLESCGYLENLPDVIAYHIDLAGVYRDWNCTEIRIGGSIAFFN